jgi:hypothetical protein
MFDDLSPTSGSNSKLILLLRCSLIIGDIKYATHLAAILYMHSPMQIGRQPLQLPYLSVPLGLRAILEALGEERVS